MKVFSKYHLDRGSLACVRLLRMVHAVPFNSWRTKTWKQKKGYPHRDTLNIHSSSDGFAYIHVQAQSDDSVSMQIKRSLSDGAGVTSTCGELTSPHLSPLNVKHPAGWKVKVLVVRNRPCDGVKTADVLKEIPKSPKWRHEMRENHKKWSG